MYKSRISTRFNAFLWCQIDTLKYTEKMLVILQIRSCVFSHRKRYWIEAYQTWPEMFLIFWYIFFSCQRKQSSNGSQVGLKSESLHWSCKAKTALAQPVCQTGIWHQPCYLYTEFNIIYQTCTFAIAAGVLEKPCLSLEQLMRRLVFIDDGCLQFVLIFWVFLRF